MCSTMLSVGCLTTPKYETLYKVCPRPKAPVAVGFTHTGSMNVHAHCIKNKQYKRCLLSQSSTLSPRATVLVVPVGQAVHGVLRSYWILSL